MFPSKRREALKWMLMQLVNEHAWKAEELDDLGCLEEDESKSVLAVKSMVKSLFRGELQ